MQMETSLPPCLSCLFPIKKGQSANLSVLLAYVLSRVKLSFHTLSSITLIQSLVTIKVLRGCNPQAQTIAYNLTRSFSERITHPKFLIRALSKSPGAMIFKNALG
jgi:hypothetical protein